MKSLVSWRNLNLTSLKESVLKSKVKVIVLTFYIELDESLTKAIDLAKYQLFSKYINIVRTLKTNCLFKAAQINVLYKYNYCNSVNIFQINYD